RNWHLDPASQTLHFASSPAHPSNQPSSTAAAAAAAAARAASGVPAGMATGAGLALAGADGIPGARELDRSAVVCAALRYAKELESIV
ncbi:hypothetical protein JCM3770_000148, partial [Rhodotorula araucariae]